MPLMRALVLNNQDDPQARIRKDEYLFGPDMLVAPVLDQNLSRPVYLPTNGDPSLTWLNYWTGESTNGGTTIIADAPLDVIPVYIRAGAVLPKIPEDVMTLVPSSESGNKTIKTLDDRRVYEIIGSSPQDTLTKDFEGRELTHAGNTLKITGEKKAHVILRWKFTAVHSATLNGAPLTLQPGATAEFDYIGTPATIAWQ